MTRQPRRQRILYPLSDGSHVPNAWDKWLASLFTESEWIHAARPAEWFQRFVKLAMESGCKVIHDGRRHWKESIYFPDYHGKGPHILVGGRGDEASVGSAALHELGHHVLRKGTHSAADFLEEEENAWHKAHQLAQEHRLPILGSIRRQALYSYRYHQMLQTTRGSKKRTRLPALTTSDRIAGSKHTAHAGRSWKELPAGKKGRRLFKKEVKRRSARTIRRRGVAEGE